MRMNQLIINVRFTEFITDPKGPSLEVSKPEMPRLIISIGRKMPIPYTPSPEHPQGTPEKITF